MVDDTDLDRLRELPTPPVNADTKARALAAAMSAFREAGIEKKSAASQSAASQVMASLPRLLSRAIMLLSEVMSNRRFVAQALVAILALPVAGYVGWTILNGADQPDPVQPEIVGKPTPDHMAQLSPTPSPPPQQSESGQPSKSYARSYSMPPPPVTSAPDEARASGATASKMSEAQIPAPVTPSKSVRLSPSSASTPNKDSTSSSQPPPVAAAPGEAGASPATASSEAQTPAPVTSEPPRPLEDKRDIGTPSSSQDAATEPASPNYQTGLPPAATAPAQTGAPFGANQPHEERPLGRPARAATPETGARKREFREKEPAPPSSRPPPVDRSVADISKGIDALAVNSAWQAEGARVCAAAIDGRYPFDRNAVREVAMDDFVRVFGPRGVFETFFADKLAPFVDTTANPWRWRGVLGAEGQASEALAQFGRARQIRQAFFGTSDQPSISITITPETLDQSASAVILEVQGERIIYVHGRILPETIRWPAREKVSLTRLAFLPGGLDEAMSFTGPWSTMRLFDAAEKTQLSDDRFRALFTSHGHSAGFEIQVSSSLNPFTADVLSAFRCPDKF